jgi:hypothetical protein
MDTTPKYYAITFQNGLTFYAKGISILECVSISRGMCGRVIKARKLTAEEYAFRLRAGRNVISK